MKNQRTFSIFLTLLLVPEACAVDKRKEDGGNGPGDVEELVDLPGEQMAIFDDFLYLLSIPDAFSKDEKIKRDMYRQRSYDGNQQIPRNITSTTSCAPGSESDFFPGDIAWDTLETYPLRIYEDATSIRERIISSLDPQVVDDFSEINKLDVPHVGIVPGAPPPPVLPV
ncbi:uncharacterized protein LOC133193629 [Saccostrea echinata]|uniref:uncharacterized protein LOC133193629 n=1 Tax=Saccostrea echinata TaxID=191078 RepID=UPI002A82863A|nr:uncharacterized protein LOC133193629 [Saccostrea echinata]XP_061185568.1 uncharacterized protein LOC133193629 [Saccostrea echinata]XP_061185569.1 uncharacterized protein LOC133193629 [Saccostrea echinata]